jgi:hypothetical protein
MVLSSYYPSRVSETGAIDDFLFVSILKFLEVTLVEVSPDSFSGVGFVL